MASSSLCLSNPYGMGIKLGGSCSEFHWDKGSLNDDDGDGNNEGDKDDDDDENKNELEKEGFLLKNALSGISIGSKQPTTLKWNNKTHLNFKNIRK